MRRALGRVSSSIPNNAMCGDGVMWAPTIWESRAKTEFQKLITNLHCHRIWKRFLLCPHWRQQLGQGLWIHNGYSTATIHVWSLKLRPIGRCSEKLRKGIWKQWSSQKGEAKVLFPFRPRRKFGLFDIVIVMFSRFLKQTSCWLPFFYFLLLLIARANYNHQNYKQDCGQYLPEIVHYAAGGIAAFHFHLVKFF